MIKRARCSMLAVRVGSDPFMTFVPSMRIEHFKNRVVRYRRGEDIEILDELELISFVEGDYRWGVDDWVVHVKDGRFLGYGMEDFCFSQQITERKAWIKKREISEIKKAISENKFVFARTMAHNPHEYAIRGKWNDATVTFDEFLEFMWSDYSIERFGNRMYRVSVIDGVRYWTMGGAEAITIILNRGVK